MNPVVSQCPASKARVLWLLTVLCSLPVACACVFVCVCVQDAVLCQPRAAAEVQHNEECFRQLQQRGRLCQVLQAHEPDGVRLVLHRRAPWTYTLRFLVGHPTYRQVWAAVGQVGAKGWPLICCVCVFTVDRLELEIL